MKKVLFFILVFQIGIASATLPVSGAISVGEIGTEFQGQFGVPERYKLSTYYSAVPGLPASGAISFSDFYGLGYGLDMVAGQTGSTVVTRGYSLSVIGSMTPTTWQGHTIRVVYEQHTSGTQHRFFVQMETDAPLTSFTSVSFTDRNGIPRTFQRVDAVNVTGTGSFRTWTFDPGDTTTIYFTSGNTYKIKFFE